MKSWLVNLAPVVQTLDSAIVTTAAQVLRACNVTTCFLNLTLCSQEKITDSHFWIVLGI